jgi:hypothetical protein
MIFKIWHNYNLVEKKFPSTLAELGAGQSKNHENFVNYSFFTFLLILTVIFFCFGLFF